MYKNILISAQMKVGSLIVLVKSEVSKTIDFF